MWCTGGAVTAYFQSHAGKKLPRARRLLMLLRSFLPYGFKGKAVLYPSFPFVSHESGRRVWAYSGQGIETKKHTRARTPGVRGAI